VLVSALIVAVLLCGFLLFFHGRAAANVVVPLMAGDFICYCNSANGTKSSYSVKDYMVDEVRMRMGFGGISDEEKWWFEHLLEPDVARACKQAWSEPHPTIAAPSGNHFIK